MRNAGMILNKLLHPPKPVLLSVPTVAFSALIIIFAAGKKESVLAYPTYGLSAYALCILLAAVPRLAKRIKSAILNTKTVQKAAASAIVRRYLHDLAFRGSICIFQGMLVNFLYVIFRAAAGIYYRSVWFLSIAVYYLVLGGLRAYLFYCYYNRKSRSEYRCYRRTAWLLFLLNIPMGGMIVLMVRTNSGFSYPGYIIYLSALYTFYTMVTSVINLVKYRKLGSPILSAAKVLNFVAAMMSILALQTAMISQFSTNAGSYYKLMNSITGGFIYGIVVVIAIYMLLHSRKIRKRVDFIE